MIYTIYNYYYCHYFRFESTVIGQFLGHVHEDAFSVFFADEENTTRPIKYIYIIIIFQQIINSLSLSHTHTVLPTYHQALLLLVE